MKDSEKIKSEDLQTNSSNSNEFLLGGLETGRGGVTNINTKYISLRLTVNITNSFWYLSINIQRMWYNVMLF